MTIEGLAVAAESVSPPPPLPLLVHLMSLIVGVLLLAGLLWGLAAQVDKEIPAPLTASQKEAIWERYRSFRSFHSPPPDLVA